MIGVILFLRVGWILGNVGILKMGIIAAISSLLLFLTSLSITSIVSNMRMRGGGAYFIISRSLGIEIGSAIGILQSASQICFIALSTTGACLSIQEILPNIPEELIKIALLTILLCLAYFSSSFALKMEIVIFLAILLSIAAIFIGFTPPKSSCLNTPITLGFWSAFAMFFPAITGIESGMAMSGDLKNPSRSLAIGTISAVVSIFLLYFGISFFLSQNLSYQELRDDPLILYHTNKYTPLIFLGVFASSFAGAMGAMIGEPRVVQAIAKDGILPKFLSYTKISTLFVFATAFALVLWIDINQLIPMMTMVCLTSYGLINFIAFFQSFLKNPSWRPTFQIHWMVPLLASVGCFLAMLLINSAATLVVIGLVTLLCFWTASRKLNRNLNDIRYSLYSYFVEKWTAKLSDFDTGAKNWRPHILALFDQGMLQKNLAFFAHALNQEKGFLTFGSCQKTDTTSLLEYLKEFKIPSYLHVNALDNSTLAADQMIKNYGFGHLKPNTILFSLPSHFPSFVQLLLDTHHQKKNIILLKDEGQMDYLYSDPSKINKKIHLWWRGKNPGNFELALALAYLLQQSKLWKKAKISLQMIAKDEKVEHDLIEQFEKYRSRLRIKDLEFSPIIDAKEDFFSHLEDQKADLTFLGLMKPTPSTTVEKYGEYYKNLLEQTKSIKNIAYVLAGEEIAFRRIFL